MTQANGRIIHAPPLMCNGVITSAQVVNEMQTFRDQYVRTGATIDWSASSQGDFTFVSEPPNPERNRYAIIAHEPNGSCFPSDADD